MFLYLESIWQKLLRDLIGKPWYFVIAGILFLLFWYFLGLESSIFLTILFLWLLLEWDIKIIGFFAIVCLVSATLLAGLDLDQWADQVIVWFFYFISIAIIVQFTDTVKIQWFLYRYKTKKDKLQKIENLENKFIFKKDIKEQAVNNLNSLKTITDQFLEDLERDKIFDKKRTQKDQQIYTRQKTNLDFSQFFLDVLEQILYFAICLGLAYFFFNFKDIFAFRDLTVVPKVFNFTLRPLLFVDYLLFSQNFFVNLGLTANQFWSLVIISIFTLINFSSFLSLYAFTKQSFKKNLNENFYIKILCFCWSLLYTYNPWTLERFLMGHLNVLLGQIFLLPVFLLFYLFLKNSWKDNLKVSIKFPKLEQLEYLSQIEKNKPKILKFLLLFSLGLLILTFVNIHQTFFIYYLFILAFCLNLLKEFFESDKNKVQLYLSENFLRILWRKYLLPLLAFVPSAFILWLQYSQELTKYFNNITSKDYQFQIIEAFSLQILGKDNPFQAASQNFLERALIGSASWNTPTFIEIYDKQENNYTSLIESLDFWQEWSIYFNSFLALIFITWLFSSVFLGLIFSHRQQKNWFWWLLSIGIILSLVFNFGLNKDFQFLNRWFYRIPLSYVFRESGKFYGLFLALSTTVFAKYYQFWPKILKYLHSGFLFFVVFSNILVFIPLKESINYIKYPQSFKQINQICTQKDKILLLPHTAYWLPHYSPNIFTIQPSIYFRCPVLSAKSSTITRKIKDQTYEELILESDPQDQQIDLLIKNYLLETDNRKNFENFINKLKQKQISILVVEEFEQPDLKNLNARLSQYIDYNKEKTIYWYKLNK